MTGNSFMVTANPMLKCIQFSEGLDVQKIKSPPEISDNAACVSSCSAADEEELRSWDCPGTASAQCDC